MKTSLVLPIATLGLALVIAATGPMGSAHAQEKQIYGHELMTEQERTEFRSRLQGAASDEERQQIRWEHRMRMEGRAKERGVTLPDEPPRFGMQQQPRRGGGGQGRHRLPHGGGGGRRGG